VLRVDGVEPLLRVVITQVIPWVIGHSRSAATSLIDARIFFSRGLASSLRSTASPGRFEAALSAIVRQFSCRATERQAKVNPGDNVNL
jgi:hypothetical protein